MPRSGWYIVKDKEYVSPFMGGDVTDDHLIRATWDPSRTHIISSWLRLIADDGDAAGVDVYHDDSRVVRVEWPLLNWGRKEASGSFSLVNGFNRFRIRCWKGWGNIWERRWIVTLILYIEYEGEEPKVEGARIPKFPRLKWYHWLAIGMGVVGAGLMAGALKRGGGPRR